MSPLPEERTLADLLREIGPLRPRGIARIVVQACHTLTIVPFSPEDRRDLHPATIVLETSTDGELVVAILRSRERGSTSPDHVSPEQATNASAPDERSDVYSLCVILYEGLSASLPFPSCATLTERVNILCTLDRRPLAAAAPWIDPALARVVERGLERDPGNRWWDPRALGEALLPFTGGSERLTALDLSPLPAAERLRSTPEPGPRRSRPKGALQLGLLLVAAALLAGASWLADHPRVLHALGPARPVESEPAWPVVIPPVWLAPSAPIAPRAPLPAKEDIALQLLDKSSLLIHLDPRRSGVVVPRQLRNQAQLVLQVGRHMAIPIPDLAVSDAGISATLSFSQKPSRCVVPWSAVYALVGEDGQGMVWPDDQPPELAAAEAKKQASDAGRAEE